MSSPRRIAPAPTPAAPPPPPPSVVAAAPKLARPPVNAAAATATATAAAAAAAAAATAAAATAATVAAAATPAARPIAPASTPKLPVARPPIAKPPTAKPSALCTAAASRNAVATTSLTKRPPTPVSAARSALPIRPPPVSLVTSAPVESSAPSSSSLPVAHAARSVAPAVTAALATPVPSLPSSVAPAPIAAPNAAPIVVEAPSPTARAPSSTAAAPPPAPPPVVTAPPTTAVPPSAAPAPATTTVAPSAAPVPATTIVSPSAAPAPGATTVPSSTAQPSTSTAQPTTATPSQQAQPLAIHPSLLPPRLKSHDVIFVNGQPFNNRGYRVCGVANQRGRLCGRIGTCPFHAPQKRPRTSNPQPQPKPSKAAVVNMTTPPQRARFKRSWTPQEHRSFLRAMRRHGKGKWKEIAAEVGSRTANQCQSHAQKYFLRQAKSDTERKKKSIHDIHDIVDEDKSCKPASPTVRKATVIAPASVLPHPSLSSISQSFTSSPVRLGATPIAPATFNYAALLPQFLTASMPDPSRATIVAPPPAPRVRVTVHVNGQAKGGMALLVPDTLEKFFETAASKLKTELVFTRIFTRSGGEITSVDELCQDDMLWLSSGQDFLTPK